MARIVYGVSGEGSGHSSRSRAMATHLLSLGHEVKIVSYDRGYANLKDDFDCFETQGLHIGTRDNKVSVTKTLYENARKLPQLVAKARQLKRELFNEFDPHAVISDFEPMTGYLARATGRPLISLDNQHRIRYMTFPCPRSMTPGRLMTRIVIQGMIPPPDVALVTTFYFGEVANDRTFLFPPILRGIVLKQTPSRGDHILVYHTRPYDSFIEYIKQFPRERFMVYGYNREGEDGPLHFKPFSVEGFMHDLVTCKAVMATAGFTLMTEALHLGKPFLATPMKGQFEQELNGLLLDELGYGKNARAFSPETVGDFLDSLPQFETKLATYESDHNAAIAQKLTELTANNCALAREMREKRRGGHPVTNPAEDSA
jgi:uncharacterized protein (TIGR00661 family)